MNSCQAAYNDIFRSQGLVRQTSIPTPHSAPGPSLKRQLPIEGGPMSTGRAIQPKPSISNIVIPSPPEPPPKRKRGRPTKAEAQAKADAAALRGDPPPPQRQDSRVGLAQLLSSTEETRPRAVAESPRPLAVLTTPTGPKSASHSSSSSGKRRRAKPARLELEERTLQDIGTAAGPAYQSPYSRIGPDTQETPTIGSSTTIPLEYTSREDMALNYPQRQESGASYQPTTIPREDSGSSYQPPHTQPPTTSGADSLGIVD